MLRRHRSSHAAPLKVCDASGVKTPPPFRNQFNCPAVKHVTYPCGSVQKSNAAHHTSGNRPLEDAAAVPKACHAVNVCALHFVQLTQPYTKYNKRMEHWNVGNVCIPSCGSSY